MSGSGGAGPKNARTREWPATKKLQQEDCIGVSLPAVERPGSVACGDWRWAIYRLTALPGLINIATGIICLTFHKLILNKLQKINTTILQNILNHNSRWMGIKLKKRVCYLFLLYFYFVPEKQRKKFYKKKSLFHTLKKYTYGLEV